MNKLLDSLHKKILNHKFAEVVSEAEVWELVKAKRRDDGWIPCNERLPEGELICVIGCFKNGNVEVLLYQGGGIFENDYGTGLYNTKQVIAWQPLPPKYEPKGE